ncbi:MAG: DUF86 domain-containing protein [Bacteroidota bacterium]|nr:DUF86 domain-containing protein [Bacteroidota bacterium]
MSISQLEFLRHILDECDFINSVVNGKKSHEVIDNPITSRAIVRSLEIIGEASKKVDAKFKAQYPQVEWKKMAGMRDRLIHDYIGVDYILVWDVVTKDIPLLTVEIKAILAGNW